MSARDAVLYPLSAGFECAASPSPLFAPPSAQMFPAFANQPIPLLRRPFPGDATASFPSKRRRPRDGCDGDVRMDEVSGNGQSTTSCYYRQHPDVESPFAGIAAPTYTAADIATKFAPPSRRKKTTSIQQNAIGNQLPQQNTYTTDQVLDIVQSAVGDATERLRAEYEIMLQTKLREQFMQFSKFNEDNISRRMEEHSFSYVS